MSVVPNPAPFTPSQLGRIPPWLQHAVKKRGEWSYCALERSCFGPIHDLTPSAPFHHLGICLDPEPLRTGWTMDGRRHQVDLPAESVCVMPADATFLAWWNRPADMACLYFTPDALREVAGEEFVKNDGEIFPMLALHSPTVSRLIRALHDDAERNHPYGRMLGDSIFVALVAALMQDRRVMWEHTYRSGIGDRRVRKAMEYIHSHLTDPLDVGSIAGAAETSPFHLTRSFRAAMGCSLWQYVLRQRVRVAQGLMLDRALTLAEVAAMSGFESYSAFAASFKSHLGVAPAKYRTLSAN